MRHSLTPRLGALGLACLVLVSFPPAGVFAQDAPSPDAPFDFASKRQFFEDLWGQRTFLPTYQISIDHRSRIKSVAQDCEVHIAGTLIGETFGEPRFVVVKPPNLCKFLPGATEPSSSSTRATWRAIRAFRPRVVQIQYNAVFVPPQTMVIEYHPLNSWTARCRGQHPVPVQPRQAQGLYTNISFPTLQEHTVGRDFLVKKGPSLLLMEK